LFATTSNDGTRVLARDDGEGPAIMVLGPGSDDGTAWGKVAQRLAPRYRVLRVHRRQYRLDLEDLDGFPMAREADDAIAVASAVGAPVLIVGHSSGGVAALEALVRSPSSFKGAFLYEPAVTVLGEPWDEPLGRAVAAIDAGNPGRAMTIFARDVVHTSALIAHIGGALVGVLPKYRALAPRQIFDMKAIHDLGIRLDAYAAIDAPTLLLSGERSPKHLGERIDALAEVMPHAEKVMFAGQGHTGNKKAPKGLADLIAGFYDRVLKQSTA
jgi:pimeloyl-ACP methyl ester carboxylesterase